MKYYTIPPPPSLSGYVRFFWVLESDDPYTHRSMADGCVEMVFHYNGIFDEVMPDNKPEKSYASGIQGPSQYFRRFTISKGFGIFGVYLYPFAVTQLFSLPTTEITNQMPDMETFMGQRGKDLEEKIMLATDNAQRVKIMSEFLENQLLKNNSTPHYLCRAIRDIIQRKGNIRVNDIAAQHFLSTRQFERKFKELAGFAPKLYARIIRFQAATFEYCNKHKSLTDIAYECGYYDQSHFINEFKAFSGFHPKAYFSGATEATAWIDA